MDQGDKFILCVALFALAGALLTLVWAYIHNRTPVAQFENSWPPKYRTKTGVPIYCIQGGKSIAGRRHARGNWEPGDEKIYDEEA